MPAYVIAESPFRDDDEIRRYRLLAAASVHRHAGRYLVRGSRAAALEGDWGDGDRWVIIEFPSVEQANAWYESVDYQAALATRTAPVLRRICIVNG